MVVIKVIPIASFVKFGEGGGDNANLNFYNNLHVILLSFMLKKIDILNRYY